MSDNSRAGASRTPVALLGLVEPLVLGLAIFYLLYEFLLSHVEGDQAYLLYAAQQVLAGVQLDGPRLIETNPPLIVWFSEIPAAMARLLHMDVVLSLRLVVLAMLSVGAAWGARILRLSRVPAIFGRPAGRLLWALTFIPVLLIQPAEFGQREQLLLALFLPYLLAVGTSAVDRLATGERTLLGLCAGLAICFKPHHLLTIVAVELFLAGYHRSLRRLLSPEVLASIAAGLLYVAAVRGVTPTYLSVITPLLRSTYWALGQYSLSAMVFHVGLPLTLCALGGAVCFATRRQQLAFPQLAGTLLAAATGATLAYFVQHTGWYHQGFPATALFQIAAVWLLADVFRSRLFLRPATTAFQRMAWVLLPACGVLLFLVAVQRAYRRPVSQPDLTSELAKLPRGTTVYAFSVGMNAFPVVIERHLLWGSRFAHLWMLPAIRANEAAATTGARVNHALSAKRVTELAALQRRETTDDLLRTGPLVIFVERCAERMCESYTGPFDAVQWFSQDPDFARVWQGYHRDRQLADFDEYRRN